MHEFWASPFAMLFTISFSLLIHKPRSERAWGPLLEVELHVDQEVLWETMIYCQLTFNLLIQSCFIHFILIFLLQSSFLGNMSKASVSIYFFFFFSKTNYASISYKKGNNDYIIQSIFSPSPSCVDNGWGNKSMHSNIEKTVQQLQYIP